TQVSLLLGLSFALFYAVVAIPIGKLADSYNRVAIIVGGALFWSVATLGCMIAGSYWQLFAARMMVGIGEATLIPAGYSVIGDYFRPGRVATATSIITGASFLGSGLALVLGGLLIDALPTSAFVSLPLVGEVRSWQLAFGLASIPTFAVLLLFFFVREPARRGAGTTTQAATPREAFAFLATDKALWGSLYIGMSLLSAFQFGLTAWIPTFFMRTYDWTTAEAGQMYGTMFVVVGTLGTLSGGWICDRLFDRIGRRAFVMTPLLGSLICLPSVFVFALASDATVSTIALVPLTYFATVAFGAAIAAIPSLAPNRMRAQLIAAYMLLAAIVGQGGGPWLIAIYTDYVARDPALIAQSIAIVCPILLIATVLVLWNSVRRIGAIDAAK
ncbi:MAG: MFS transporter, partial [Alphaproteobacteria bacterium]|nr:MFS transporter [Alphaproteobacteria bacterium]